VTRRALWMLVALAGATPLATHVRAAPVTRVAKGKAKARGEAHVDRPVVGVGDVVLYSIGVVTTDDAPSASAPAPGKIDGFESLGSSTSTQQAIVMRGAGVERTTTITVTYRLRAKTMGAHVLGPGRITLDGEPVAMPKVAIEVVAAGTAPAPKKAPAKDPFDDLFFDEPPEPPPQPKEVAPADPMAAVDTVPTDPIDRHTFVRLAVDESKPIVGAQVTAKIFVYRRRPVHIDGIKHAPGFADFHVVELEKPEEDWHSLTIGGEMWEYARLKAFAIFPLRTGTLTIAPAEIEMRQMMGMGVMSGKEEDHSTNELKLAATEPPSEGRPAGYSVGDVASSLDAVAEINPRVVVDGHAMLTVRLRGLGRIEKIRPVLPTLVGAKFTQTGDDARTTLDGFMVRCARKISYDVAVDRLGDLDLGDALVNVWDPAKKSYLTVKAALGSVRVEALPPRSSESANELQLPPPRTDEGPSGEGSSIADRAWTWCLVGGAPLAVLVLQGGAALARRTRRRVGEARETPASHAKRALGEARSCERRGDDKGACTALMRAIDRALEAASGVRSRGVTRGELSRALDGSTLPRELALEATDMLHALESARFAEAERPSLDACRSLVDRLLEAAPKIEERP
jgi:hypothetical protein